jgi:hypothetical protein
MADDGEKIDIEQLEKMEGAIPELARRTSQPCKSRILPLNKLISLNQLIYI